MISEQYSISMASERAEVCISYQHTGYCQSFCFPICLAETVAQELVRLAEEFKKQELFKEFELVRWRDIRVKDCVKIDEIKVHVTHVDFNQNQPPEIVVNYEYIVFADNPVIRYKKCNP